MIKRLRPLSNVPDQVPINVYPFIGSFTYQKKVFEINDSWKKKQILTLFVQYNLFATFLLEKNPKPVGLFLKIEILIFNL